MVKIRVESSDEELVLVKSRLISTLNTNVDDADITIKIRNGSIESFEVRRSVNDSQKNKDTKVYIQPLDGGYLVRYSCPSIIEGYVVDRIVDEIEINNKRIQIDEEKLLDAISVVVTSEGGKTVCRIKTKTEV